MTDLRNLFTRLGVLTSRPGAFFVIALYGSAWLYFARETFEWHAGATLATWMMTVFIQRATHRDTQAIHAKLDHLLDRIDKTDGRLAELDQMQPEDIEEFRKSHIPRDHLARSVISFF
jgi:low affinity Fe/Cu permease